MEGDASFQPTVEYDVNGRTYTQVLDQSSASYAVGQTIDIMYNPDNPEDIHGTGGFSVIILIIGVALLALSIVLAMNEKKSIQEENHEV